MIKTIKKTLSSACLSGALMLSACASTPTVEAAGPSSEKAAMSERPDGMASIIITREYEAPVLMKAHIEINDQRLTALRNSEYTQIYLPPGEYKLSAKFAAARGVTYQIKVDANESYGWEFHSPVTPTFILLPTFKPFSPEDSPEKYNALTKVESKPYSPAP